MLEVKNLSKIYKSKVKNGVDTPKFEKIYKKVFSSLDNFLNLCYTNMNYYVKMRRNWLWWSIGVGKGR